MQRIIDPTAVAALPSPPALAGTTGFFSGGLPGVSVATRVRYWWLNMVQEELSGLVTAAGLALDTTATNFGQCAAAVRALAASAVSAVPHGVQAFTASGTFTVPAGVTEVEVEIWGAGSGSWASVAGITGGGGSGGGYARKRVSGLTPGAAVSVALGAGGSSAFGSYCSASGGTVNPSNTLAYPASGNIAGTGTGGDLNLCGGDGGNGQQNQGGIVLNNGGYGGEGPLCGGIVNSGAVGNPGRFPGGGAAGAGGFCLVRW
jgi:hypothetical protein